MNYIFYQTKTKFTNAGDILINKALISKLRSFGKIKANCSKDIPEEFLKKLEISKEEKFPSKNEIGFALSIIKFKLKNKKDNVYIFSGLGDSYGGGAKRVIRNCMSGCVYALYKIFGIHTVRIGRSVGYYTKPMAFSERVKALFTDHNFLRDTKSLQKCEEMKIKGGKYCPDMSWLYECDKERSFNNGNTVAFFMRAAVTGKYEANIADIIVKRCEELLRMLYNQIGDDLVVIFAYQVVEDKVLAEELYERFKNIYKCEFVAEQLDLDNVEQVYARTAFHVSNRLHSLLLGYKYGSVPIALLDKEKHYKITSTFEDSQLDDLILDYNEIINEKDVLNIYDNRQNFYEKIVSLEKDNTKIINDLLSEAVFVIK